ncbi:phenylacetate--CoA ligase family protein [Corynebacterium gerontici]|uniref:Phenylacetate--CoA ligase n=1 Tax=Corynebacterium gerontici TaxID=2079234 RepID=A0A3G6IXL6_9CORY|nr:hypothetical protein [Corynebacterium gerontici]AZA10432.1 hypothetical protein CGERO_00470 [Corynebacterium gerontici]
MLGYPSHIIRATIGAKRARPAAEAAQQWAADAIKAPEVIAEEQLARFNAQWTKAQHLPFYIYWQKEHDLPARIERLEDLDNWPVLSKDHLREREDLVRDTPGTTAAYRTSGSTGSPFSFPRGGQELIDGYARTWAYREAHGLRPFDSFLLAANTLGHQAHTRKGYVQARAKRIAKDVAGNSWTVPGLIANPEQADAALRAIRVLRPRYLVGYTSALVMIAQRYLDTGARGLGSVTHVIPTSETVTPADAAVLSNLGEVIVEYGAVETGVIAASMPGANLRHGWPIQVLWPWILLREHAVVSTLSQRVFPLVNYSLGDDITASKQGPGGTILELAAVEGRTRDVITLASNHGSIDLRACELSMLVRNIDGVLSAQVAPTQGEGADIAVVCAQGTQHEAIAAQAERSLRMHHPGVAKGRVRLRFVDAFVPLARGKRGVAIEANRIPEHAPTKEI